MSKSNFSALVEAKKQRDGAEAETLMQSEKQSENDRQAKKITRKTEKSAPEPMQSASSGNRISNSRPSKRETVRRSYRVDEAHDKAIKVMSKFMGQGTEEEIVLSIFAYFFENDASGQKAMQMVGLLENK